jgi:hypothetical protein
MLIARPGCLAGPGIVTHNQYEYRDGDKRMNQPTQHRCHDMEQDANNRP